MKMNNQFFLSGNSDAAVMLINGINTGALEMTPMARFLNDYGFSVFGMNLAGHGTYPQDLQSTKMEDFIWKGEYDLSRIKAEYKRVYIGGVSTGALVCLHLAATCQVDGVISLSAPLKLKKGTFISDIYPKDYIYFHRPMDNLVGLNRQYHLHYEDIAVCIYDELRRLMAKVGDPQLLKNISCPALIVQAKDDIVVSAGSAKTIFSSISSADKTLYQPKKGTHDIMLSEARHETFIKCAKFLCRLEDITYNFA